MVTGYSFTKLLIVVPKDPFNKHFIVQFHALLSMNNRQFTVQGKASMLADIHCDSFDSSQVSLLVKFWFMTADRKLELGHIAPVHSTTCIRYPDKLLPQNTIYLINKSLLNTKLHLPAWQQLTDCETSVNPDQTFCFWVLLADAMRLPRTGRCACLAGSDMRSS